MALRTSKADSAWKLTHNNAHLLFHVSSNNSGFVIQLYGDIADQSTRSSFKLHTKAEVVRTWLHQNFRGPCIDFY